MVRKLFVFILIFVVAALSLTACGGAAGKPSSVKIAVSVPDAIGYGQLIRNTLELALEEVGGEINGIRIEYVYIDTSEPGGNPVSPDLEKNAAELAAGDEDVILYIGPASSNQAKMSIPILNEAGIAQLSPTTTWPGLTKPGFAPGEPGIYYPTGQRTFFRMAPSDDVQGVVAAKWAAQLGFEKILVVDDNSAFGVGVSGIFEVTAGDLGLEIIGHESYDAEAENSAADYEAYAEKILSYDADLVYFGGAAFPGGLEYISAVRSLDPTLPIMGPDGIVQDDFASGLGENGEGILGTTVALPASALDTPAAAEFVSSYEAAYGEAPGSYLANLYEAIKVAFYALEITESYTREGIVNTLAGIEDYSGVLGTWSFTPEGDVSITTIGGMEIRDGAWQFVEVID